MTSSLYGIYNAQRAIALNQAAINIINNNIANINTPGYSKQRLEISQATLTTPDSHLTMVASQSGLGPSIDSISRNREVYLDSYFRKENSNLSYFTELKENMSVIEDITNELSDSGISKELNEFYSAAQQLSLNPADSVTRNNFVQRALDVTTKFNQISSQLTQLRTSLVGNGTDANALSGSKLNLETTDLNQTLKNIAELNHTISVSSSQGISPNGLLDERDRLMDKISEFIPINITEGHNNLVSISFNGVDLVNGAQQIGSFKTVLGDAATPAKIQIVSADNESTVLSSSDDVAKGLTTGKLAAIYEVGSSDSTKINISDMLSKLDTLAGQFADQVNTIQQNGKYITSVNPPKLHDEAGTPADPAPVAFFTMKSGATSITAASITVNQEIISNPLKIAAASSTAQSNATGDGSNSLLIAQLRNKTIPGLNNLTTEGYLTSVTGNFGVQVSSINNKYDTQTAVIDQIELKRESVMGVNLDEELTDLIKYQRGYEASAKILNVVDQILQKVIGLGST